MESCQNKPIIKYPCKWSYRIIGSDRSSIQNAVDQALPKGNFHIELSNVSKKGKYISLNLETTVVSEKNRKEIYQTLMAHSAIKIVL